MFVQPLDLVKNRMQISGEGGSKKLYKNSFDAFKTIIRNEGVKGIYTGLSAGLLRQATYTTTQMGIFSSLIEKYSKNGTVPLNFFQKAAIGLFSGGVAAFVGTPTEVALIRLSTDGQLPVDQRRGYKNAFDAIFRIAREEKVTTLWKGAAPTVIRAMVVNGAQ